MISYALAFFCVLGIATGQILFKLTAIELGQVALLYNYKAFIYFISAVAVYGLTSIGWVIVLKNVDLGRIYPFMALAFVLVPLGSYYILNERFQSQYFIGVIIIMIGIIITVRS